MLINFSDQGERKHSPISGATSITKPPRIIFRGVKPGYELQND